jgi:tetratricopeptide (TPR) repeat protein
MQMRLTQFSLAWLMVISLGCGAQRWVKQGNEELSNDHPNAAARAYREALKREPSLATALRGLAASHLAREEPIRAILPAQRALRSGDPQARAILAEALILTGRPADAKTSLQAGLATDPAHHAWLRLHVEATLASGDLTGAAELSESLAGVDRPQAQAMRGWALARAGQAKAAAEVAARLIEMAPESARYQTEAAAIFREAGQSGPRDLARDIARSNLPSSPSDLLREATFHLKGGDIEGAIRRLSWARALYPLNSEVPRQLGMSYAQRGDWSRAARELAAALSMPPFSQNRVVHSVQVAHAGGISRESRRRNAVVAMATRLGEAHANLGERRLAAAAWQLAVHTNPRASTADYVAVAKAWELAGDIDKMGAVAYTVSQLAPRDADAQHAMSRALAASGNLDAAIGYGQRAWDLAPRDVGIAVYLGELYERRREMPSARQVYQASLRHNPGDTRLLLGLQRAGR